MNDPIADMLTIIRNGYRASKTEVSSSSSSTESVSTNGEKKGKEVKKRRHV